MCRVRKTKQGRGCTDEMADGGVSTFNSIIVASLGYSTKQTMLLAIPTGMISWASSLSFSYIAVKSKYSPPTSNIKLMFKMPSSAR